jgi:hypothetical protein
MVIVKKLFILATIVLLLGLATLSAQTSTSTEEQLKPADKSEVTTQPTVMKDVKIPKGSKVFIAPMEGGFENFVIAGIQKKEVPVVIVMDRAKADYEMSGIAESEKAGWAKMLFMGSQQSREQASIKVVDIKTGGVVFGYSVNKGNSYRGKQSAGEACAKHLKEAIAEK